MSRWSGGASLVRALVYRMNRTRDSGDPCGRPAVKGAGVSVSSSKDIWIVQSVRKALMVPLMRHRRQKCFMMSMGEESGTQLKAPSISLVIRRGRSGPDLDLSQRAVWVGERESIKASMADLGPTDPMWWAAMAPVRSPAFPTRLAMIFSKVFPRYDSRDMGRRFFGLERSVHPGFGIGMHLASFQYLGKHLKYSSWEKREVSVVGQWW